MKNVLHICSETELLQIMLNRRSLLRALSSKIFEQASS
uniref:Uncharacterized protein n=1 Tax=Klebsiella oxytoca TaxID=571 RepID=A0A345WXN1_KLEOX|nr:hypothetical protein [Klebsiella oxytoca]